MSTVAVNDRVRVEPGENGEIVVVAAWCGKCKSEAMPVGDGECPWCGSRIVDESQLSAQAMLQQLRNGHEPGGLEEAEKGGAASEPSASSSPNGAAKRARGELQADVLRAVDEGKTSAVEIAALLGKADGRPVSAALATLARKKLVEKVSWGVYRVTDAGRAALVDGVTLDAQRSGRAEALAPTSPEGNTAARPASSEREPCSVPDTGPQDGNPTDTASVKAASSTVPAAGGTASRSELSLRGPLRTADIPYDADLLEDEASFLRARAAALEQIAGGIRELARLSTRAEAT